MINTIRRCSALLLVLALLMSFASFDVNAASKKTKTFYLVSSETTDCTLTQTLSNGKKSSDRWHYKSSYKYNDNGLLISESSSGDKFTYSHNKKGYITGWKEYDQKGKLVNSAVYDLNKKGRPKKVTVYRYSGNKKDVYSTTTYTYWKNGNVKTEKNKDKSNWTSMTVYNKHGDPKSDSWSDENSSGKTTFKYNKKHDTTKMVTSTVQNGEKSKMTISYKYKYKKGKIASYTSTKNDNGVTTKGTTVLTYNKHGKLAKSVYTYTEKEGKDVIANGKDVTTYKYKKVSVPKKYWKAVSINE